MNVRAFLVGFLVLLVPVVPTSQESKPVPADSVEVAARGCLKGRVFTATPSPEEERTGRGPDITGRSFRMSGPKAVMAEVKKHNGHLVEVVGLVRKTSLMDSTPGARVGNTRIVIGAPRSAPMGSPSRPPVGEGVPVLDATSVRFLSESCPIFRR